MRVVFHLGYPRTVSSYLLSDKRGRSFGDFTSSCTLHKKSSMLVSHALLMAPEA